MATPDISIVISAAALPKLLSAEHKLIPGFDMSGLVKFVGDLNVEEFTFKGNTDGVEVRIEVTPNPLTASAS